MATLCKAIGTCPAIADFEGATGRGQSPSHSQRGSEAFGAHPGASRGNAALRVPGRRVLCSLQQQPPVPGLLTHRSGEMISGWCFTLLSWRLFAVSVEGEWSECEEQVPSWKGFGIAGGEATS